MKIIILKLTLLGIFSITTHAGMMSAIIHSEEDSYFELTRAIESEVNHEKSEVNLLVWNIFKTDKKHFSKEWERLKELEKPDIAIFQEAIVNDGPFLCLERSDCDMAAAFEYDKDGVVQFSGVMTSSKYPILSGRTIHSDSREPFLKTPKSSLLSKIKIDGREVMIVNTHGINFVTLNAFKIQIIELEKELMNFDGPIIWGGDFNTWAIGRIHILNNTISNLGMEAVEFENDHYIKKALGLKLDHVFSRGVTINKATAVRSRGSDHNPMVLNFSLN